jgi:hypothetical protein
MAGKRIKKITVTAIGTPPPLPLRPLVDEVLRVTECQRAAEAEPSGGHPIRTTGSAAAARASPPGVNRLVVGSLRPAEPIAYCN